MALVPLLSKNAPADTDFLNVLARAINQLNDAVNRTAGTSSFKGRDVPSNALQHVTDVIQVSNNETVSAGTIRNFTFDYKDFQSEPVVVFTPQLIGSNTQGRSVTIVVTAVSKNSASGFVRFGEAGAYSVNVHAHATGLAPGYTS